MLNLDSLNFDKQAGLITVVAQDATTGAVLMVAHADREALERTIATGEMHYRSRTRGPWHKGATSGNVQGVVVLAADCDGDAVLALVRPTGPACHTGATSCFGDVALRAGALSELDATIAERAEEREARGDAATDATPGAVPEATTRGVRARGTPPESHDVPDSAAAHHPTSAGHTVPPQTEPAVPAPAPPSYTRRLLANRNLRLKKLGEEAAELVLACADEDPSRSAEEAADLLYHTLVALRAVGLTLYDVRRVLAERAERG